MPHGHSCRAMSLAFLALAAVGHPLRAGEAIPQTPSQADERFRSADRNGDKSLS